MTALGSSGLDVIIWGGVCRFFLHTGHHSSANIQDSIGLWLPDPDLRDFPIEEKVGECPYINQAE